MAITPRRRITSGLLEISTRSDHDFVLEELDVVDDVLLHFIGDGQRACASEFAASLLHEVDYGILNHLRVHCERRNLLCVGEAVEHGVGHVAHSALDGKEGGGYAPAFKLTDQELADVCPDSVGGLVGE